MKLASCLAVLTVTAILALAAACDDSEEALPTATPESTLLREFGTATAALTPVPGSVPASPASIDCPQVVINERNYCGPNVTGLQMLSCGSGPIEKCRTSLILDDSVITWLTYTGGASVLQEWHVLPEHEDEFSDIHKAFFIDSTPPPEAVVDSSPRPCLLPSDTNC